tara:strand:- start:30 stop:317 length:288 start_codon:yes stop_codon:yes gene_type:complete
MKPYLLTEEEKKELNSKILEWKVLPNYIERHFKFKSFIDAFSFMTKVALICEKNNHHPNWENVYSSVTIKLTTHDLGGISNLDQLIATEINKLLK